MPDSGGQSSDTSVKPDHTWSEIIDGIVVEKKRGRGRPPGSKDKQPRKPREPKQVKSLPKGGGRTSKRKERQREQAKLTEYEEHMERAIKDAEMFFNSEEGEIYDFA